MKTLKLTFFCFAFLFAGISAVIADDLCVSPGGGGGCYSTITEAIAAASDGDRIIIEPQAGEVPYAENLEINNSLEFLSDVAETQFVIQGDITITPAAGRIVTFIGMKNNEGDLTATGNSPAGDRCQVNIMDCHFVNGSIGLNYNYFDVNIVSCVFDDGSILIRHGNIIGNDITTVNNAGYYGSPFWAYTAIQIRNDAVATEDTMLIAGNKITIDQNYPTQTRIGILTYYPGQYIQIENNLFRTNLSSGSTNVDYAVYLYFNKAGDGHNTIASNTVDFTVYDKLKIGFYITNTYAGSNTEVKNNLILSNNGVGIQGSGNSGPVSLSYNFMSSPLTIVDLVDNGTNNLTSNSTVNAEGVLQGGSDAIDAGAPGYDYYDLDLTRNDVGAYGGSFTLDNFFPMTGAARVFMVFAPRAATLGNTIKVNAESFDR